MKNKPFHHLKSLETHSFYESDEINDEFPPSTPQSSKATAKKKGKGNVKQTSPNDDDFENEPLNSFNINDIGSVQILF